MVFHTDPPVGSVCGKAAMGERQSGATWALVPALGKAVMRLGEVGVGEGAAMEEAPTIHAIAALKVASECTASPSIRITALCMSLRGALAEHWAALK